MTLPAQDDLAGALEAAGQSHLVRALADLPEPDRARLENQLRALDLELVARLGALIGKPSFDPSSARFEPPELFPLEPDAKQAEHAEAARARGAQQLARGEVGFLLVAGGQASRLGYDGPKGAFPIGPVSGRLLFDYHARRILKASERHGFRPAWYVMTSPGNDAQTRACFEQNGHFGFDPADVTFFSQEMLPALDLEGRILRKEPAELFLAPNGHGGVLDALRKSGALQDLRERGCTTLSYFQVDNPLAPPADPLFLGLHSLAGAQMSTKVVSKRDAGEKVGVIGRVDGKIGCIEYSDLPESLRGATDDAGRLLFRAGNIAIHAIELAFIEELTRGGLQLPWHVAKKKMAVVDAEGRPTEVQGVKFETFVFDALGRTTSSVTLEVPREEQFSPVKNKEGEDSPATTKRDLALLSARLLREAGHDVPTDGPEGYPPVEVDPLLAEDAAELQNATDVKREASPGGLLVR